MHDLLTKELTKAYAPVKDKSIELELVLRAKAGCAKSRNQLINGQLAVMKKTAVSVLKKHGLNLDLISDAISEGVLSFDSAIRNYDTKSTARFGTYVQSWISGYMGRWAKEQGLIRVPENKTVDYIGECLKKEGLKKSEIDSFKKSQSKRQLDRLKAKFMDKYGSFDIGTTSFDAPIKETEGKTTIADTLGIEDENFSQNEFSAFFKRVTENLTDEEREIFSLYAKLGSWEAVTKVYRKADGSEVTKQALNLRYKKSIQPKLQRYKEEFGELF